MHKEAPLGRADFDGTRVQRLAAAGRAVRLSEDGADGVRVGQCVEGRNGELRRAGESQP